MVWTTELVGQHVAFAGVGPTARKLLARLSSLMEAEPTQQNLIQRYGPPTGLGLRAGLTSLAVHDYSSGLNLHHSRLQIDLRPTKPTQFASSEASSEQQCPCD